MPPSSPAFDFFLFMNNYSSIPSCSKEQAESSQAIPQASQVFSVIETLYQAFFKKKEKKISFFVPTEIF